MIKRLILPTLLFCALIMSLAFPFFSVYVSSTLPSDVAAALPEAISGFDLIVKGKEVLPVGIMPALGAINFRADRLLTGLLLVALSVMLSLPGKRGVSHVAPIVGAVGCLILVQYAFFAQILTNGLLTGVMLSAKWAVWLLPVAGIALVLIQALKLKSLPPLPMREEGWRVLAIVLSLCAALLIFLPFTQTHVQSGLFADAAMDDAMRITQGGSTLITGEQSLFSAYTREGILTDPASGGHMAELIAISGNVKPVTNLFKITTYRPISRPSLALGIMLLLAAGILHLLKSVDKWVPALLSAAGALVTGMACVSVMTLTADAQFAGITAQMMTLGLGSFTAAPMVMLVLGACAAGAAILRIRASNSPYFKNPVPPNKQMKAVTVGLAVLTCAVMLAAPLFTVGVYAPGKPQNPAVTQSISGLSLITMKRSDALTNPLDRKGASFYTQEPASNGYTAGDVDAIVNKQLSLLGVLTLLSLLLMGAFIGVVLFLKGHKRIPIVLAVLSAVLLLFTALYAQGALPKNLASAGPEGAIFIALCATLLAAFFSAFTDQVQLPKKYKLFLMMLPFLGFTLVFAYLPLAGWRYAFYDYRLGLPMDQQTFVGFKWFTQMFQNPAQRSEIFRVLRNTFAMSGIGLATSWLPVLFAILLTEIKTSWFKKFAQIFTTLPNFISWVLVFSFALTIFSLDTGVVNKVLLQLGLIKEPIAWLNSGDHIWLKMWLWSTWKGLGWGSIMYLAAIAGIDQELYEAARVDGAGRFRQIRHITIPGILPTFFVLLLLSISNVINNGMEQYLVFQNPMNKPTIEVLDLYVFNISLGSRSSTTISMATAIGILKSIVSVALLFMANGFSKAVRGESIV